MFNDLTLAPATLANKAARAAAAITCSVTMMVLAVAPLTAGDTAAKKTSCASVSAAADTVARIQLGAGC